MMRSALFIWLVSLGLQLEVILTNQVFGRPMFGRTEDVLVFFAVVPIQALLLVLWAICAKHDADRMLRSQEHREERADLAQTSQLAQLRGEGISRLVRATSDRWGVADFIFQNFASRLLVIGAALIGLALLLMLSK